MEKAPALDLDFDCTSAGWKALSEDARVWMFVSSRKLDPMEIQSTEHQLNTFSGAWAAHGVPLMNQWCLWGARVLLVAVDESAHPASGCSIDALTHFLQGLGAELQVDWFNRMLVLHRSQGGDWQESQMHAFWALKKAGRVLDEDWVLNTLVKTKGEWNRQGVQRFSTSWHADMWR